jgi:hypothetical protein
MDGKKIIEVTLLYKEKLETFESFGTQADHRLLGPAKYQVIDHCREMLNEIKIHVNNGRIEIKGVRYL